MKLTKKILTFGMAGILLFSSTACGGSSEESQIQNAIKNTNKIEERNFSSMICSYENEKIENIVSIQYNEQPLKGYKYPYLAYRCFSNGTDGEDTDIVNIIYEDKVYCREGENKFEGNIEDYSPKNPAESLFPQFISMNDIEKVEAGTSSTVDRQYLGSDLKRQSPESVETITYNLIPKEGSMENYMKNFTVTPIFDDWEEKGVQVEESVIQIVLNDKYVERQFIKITGKDSEENTYIVTILSAYNFPGGNEFHMPSFNADTFLK